MAVVAGTADAVAAVQAILAGSAALAGTNVLLMREAPEEEEEEEEAAEEEAEQAAAEQREAAEQRVAAAVAAAAAKAEAEAAAAAAAKAGQAGVSAAEEDADMEPVECEASGDITAVGTALEVRVGGGLAVHLLEVRWGDGVGHAACWRRFVVAGFARLCSAPASEEFLPRARPHAPLRALRPLRCATRMLLAAPPGLQVSELPELERRIGRYHSLVW